MAMLITSALMATACTLLLGGLLLYRTVGYHDLKTLRHTYLETLHHPTPPYPSRLLNLKGELRLAQQQQRGLDYQVLGVAVALLTFVASVLVIAVGLLLEWSSLVSGAGILFLGGSICLLLSVGANLRQVWRDHRLLETDLLELLGVTAPPSGLNGFPQAPQGSSSPRSPQAPFPAPQPPAPRHRDRPLAPPPRSIPLYPPTPADSPNGHGNFNTSYPPGPSFRIG